MEIADGHSRHILLHDFRKGKKQRKLGKSFINTWINKSQD